MYVVMRDGRPEAAVDSVADGREWVRVRNRLRRHPSPTTWRAMSYGWRQVYTTEDGRRVWTGLEILEVPHGS